MQSIVSQWIAEHGNRWSRSSLTGFSLLLFAFFIILDAMLGCSIFC
jgi:hypothetical protein